MPNSSAQALSNNAALIEFFVFIGVFTFLLLAYTHRKKTSCLMQLILCLPRQTTTSNDFDGTKQTTSQDIEKGDSPDQPGDRPVDSGSVARVLAYLHGLPREADEFLSMREISIYSLTVEEEGHSGSVRHDVIGTEESLESNWIEVVQSFPTPPDPSLLRTVLHNSDTSGLGLVVGSAGLHGTVSAAASESRPLPESLLSDGSSEEDNGSQHGSNVSSTTIRPDAEFVSLSESVDEHSTEC